MKKICASICLLLFISFSSFSQTCEERETSLLEGIGALSASYIYTTYIAVGSVWDGYVGNAYTDKSANEILAGQSSLLGHMQKTLEKMVEGNNLKTPDDKSYVNEIIATLKGLAQQSQYFQDYIKTKTDTDKDKYDRKRKSNWNRISELLGLEE